MSAFANLLRLANVKPDKVRFAGILEALGVFKQAQAAEARFRQAEQTPPAQTSPPECAKQHPESAKHQSESTKRQAEQGDGGETVLQATETAAADERQAQVHAIASDLLYWKGGLKVLRQAQLPKWRGHYKWQIEAQIEALQAEYARLRAEVATPDG